MQKRLATQVAIRIFMELKLKIKVMNDYRFNRQEVFNREDMRELMDIISDVEMLDGNHFELTNQLYGLFDGVLYDNIIHNANTNMVPIAIIRRINVLIRKIVESLVEVSDEVVG